MAVCVWCVQAWHENIDICWSQSGDYVAVGNMHTHMIGVGMVCEGVAVFLE